MKNVNWEALEGAPPASPLSLSFLFLPWLVFVLAVCLQNFSSPSSLQPGSLSFRLQLKYHLLQKAFPDLPG